MPTNEKKNHIKPASRNKKWRVGAKRQTVFYFEGFCCIFVFVKRTKDLIIGKKVELIQKKIKK